MSRAVNNALVEGYYREFLDLDSCVVVGPQGLTVQETEELREQLRRSDVTMRVVKNSLASLAIQRTGLKGVEELLDGPTAIVYGGEGALAISKLVVEARNRLKDKLTIHGGFVDGEILDAGGVEELSRTPSRGELLSMILSGFYGPVNELARGMDGLLTEMHGLVEALAEKRGGEGG